MGHLFLILFMISFFIALPVCVVLLVVEIIKNRTAKKSLKRLLIMFLISLAFFIGLMITAGEIVDEEQPQNEESEIENDISVEENQAETDSDNQDEKEENVEIKNENFFVTELNKHLDKDRADALESILKEQIGFENLEFLEKLGETLNYSIKADSYQVVVTDLGDDFRIFIPNSNYVFYEDGEIILTISELKEKSIDRNDQNSYYIIAKDIVTSCLKNPKSADFPSIVTSAQEIGMQKDGDIIVVQSYVDAQNSFGATVRSKWLVQFRVIDLKSYSYELMYLNIDGETSGEFVDMN